jgi:hypothetical protein
VAVKKKTQMDVGRIVALKQYLEKRDSTRMSDYDKVEREYGLEIDEAFRTARFPEQTRREKFYWEESDLDIDFTVPVNLYHQIVEAQKAVLGAMRNVKVPPPTNDEVGQLYADKLEKGIFYLWREWNLRRQLLLLGLYCALYGTAVGVLTVNTEKKIPMFQVRSPKGFYGIASLDDDTALESAMFVQTSKGNMVNAMFQTEYDDDEDVDIIDYYDKNERIRVIEQDTLEVFRKGHGLKACPVFTFQGIMLPGIMGASTIMRAIPVHREIQRLYTLDAKVMWLVVNAPTYIKDPQNVPPNFKWGDDATITMGAQGAIGKAGIDNMNPDLIVRRIEDMKTNLDRVNDFASISRADFQGSILTGQGVKNLLNPSAQRMESHNQGIDPILEKVNSLALISWNKIGKKKNVVGKTKGEVFSEPFDPKADINPEWVENICWIDASAFVDKQAWLISQLQKLRGEPQAVSLQSFLENDSSCEDVMGEMQRISNERMERMMQEAELMQQMQSMQQPPMPQGGIPPGEEVNPEQALPPTGPPGMEGAMPPEMAGMAGPPMEEVPGVPQAPGIPTGGEEMTSLDALIAMLNEVPAQGKIWIAGEALDGWEEDETLTLYFELPSDKSAVSDYLKRKFPKLHGTFNFKNGAPPAGVDSVLAVKGTGAVNPPPGGPPIGGPPTGPPMPEMMGGGNAI